MYNFDLDMFVLNGDRIIILEDAPPPSPLILQKNKQKEQKITYSGVVQKVSDTVTKCKVGDRVFFTGNVFDSMTAMKINGQDYILMLEGHCFAFLPSEVKEIY